LLVGTSLVPTSTIAYLPTFRPDGAKATLTYTFSKGDQL
jgi:hypothetical protein